MKRIWLILVGLLVLGGAAFGAWKWFARGGDAAAQFRTAEVQTRDIVVTTPATGTIVPEDTIDVGAQVNGLIASFGNGDDGKPVDYRSAVTEGALLAMIDDSLYAADVATAEAALNQAQAQVRLGQANRTQAQAKLDQATKDLNRADKLGVSEALAQADYDAIKSAYDQAAAAVSVAEAQIGQAQAQVAIANAGLIRARRNLNFCRITSPVSGVIIDKRVDVGQTVVASLNAPSLFLIAKDLRKMLVLVQVNEADIGKVKAGDEVTFTVDAVAGRVFHGVVRRVRLNAAITQNVVTYTVEISADNSDLALLPYLTAVVTFTVDHREQVLAVPNAALRFTPVGIAADAAAPAERGGSRGGAGRGDGAGKPEGAAKGDSAGKAPAAAKAERRESAEATGRVWVLDEDGQPRMIRVRTGLTDGSFTEVHTKELADGAQVIVGQSVNNRGGDAAANPFAPQPFRRR
jgi:HlyD family secretion protein